MSGNRIIVDALLVLLYKMDTKSCTVTHKHVAQSCQKDDIINSTGIIIIVISPKESCSRDATRFCTLFENLINFVKNGNDIL